MSDINKLYTFHEALNDAPGENYKEKRKWLRGISRLAVEIFRGQCVKHTSMDEAVTAVYLTGLYHATMLRKREDEKKVL